MKVGRVSVLATHEHRQASRTLAASGQSWALRACTFHKDKRQHCGSTSIVIVFKNTSVLFLIRFWGTTRSSTKENVAAAAAAAVNSHFLRENLTPKSCMCPHQECAVLGAQPMLSNLTLREHGCLVKVAAGPGVILPFGVTWRGAPGACSIIRIDMRLIRFLGYHGSKRSSRDTQVAQSAFRLLLLHPGRRVVRRAPCVSRPDRRTAITSVLRTYCVGSHSGGRPHAC